MLKKCAICGELRKVTMKCTRCSRTVCLNDIFVKTGVCNDCLVTNINEQYKNDMGIVTNA